MTFPPPPPTPPTPPPPSPPPASPPAGVPPFPPPPAFGNAASATPVPRKSSPLVPLLIVGALIMVTLIAGGAAALMIIAMSRGGTAAETETAADTATPAVPDLPPEQAFVEPSAQGAVPATDAPAADAPAADGAAPVAQAGRSTDGPRTGAAASDAERVRETRRQWAAEAAREAAAARDAATSRSSGATATAREAEEEEPVERAVRVGGTVRAPVKIRDVRPVYPHIAQQARIEGVVIVEATIGTDGRVSRTRVLRSIPLLDHAAIEAVRQWQYEPTLLNGVAVPVIMTVTVNFALR